VTTRSFDDAALWELARRVDVIDPPAGGWVPEGPAGEYRNAVSGELVAFPPAGLRMLWRAAGAAGVARRAAPPGVLTAGVVGADPEVWWYVAVLCRAVPAISDVAVTTEPPRRLAAELAEAGVELSIVNDVRYGSSLVVVVGAGAASWTAARAAALVGRLAGTPATYPPRPVPPR
jgi:hypothetical protein